MKSLKLNQIENSRLAKNEMKHIMGGRYTMIVGNCIVSYTCSCGCQYANSSGPSTRQTQIRAPIEVVDIEALTQLYGVM